MFLSGIDHYFNFYPYWFNLVPIFLDQFGEVIAYPACWLSESSFPMFSWLYLFQSFTWISILYLRNKYRMPEIGSSEITDWHVVPSFQLNSDGWKNWNPGIGTDCFRNKEFGTNF